MGVLTNVFRRGTVFYFRARVPVALRRRVGRAELWRSLRTQEPIEARRRGAMLVALTDALWRDLHGAMSPEEIQSLINRWVKTTLDDDQAVRLRGDPVELDLHNASVDQRLGGSLFMKVENDPRDAKLAVDELVRTLDLALTPTEYEIATRLMMRAQLEVYKGLIARQSSRWRPWLDNDPAAQLLARMSACEPVPAQHTKPPEASFGRLSDVALQATRDLQRTEQWRPKRLRDYETAVATLILALGRDPDLGEITPDVAGSWMRDLTRYPSNVTKRRPYRDLLTFRERIDVVVATNDPNVLDPVTINGKYLTPMRRIFEWRQVERRDLINPFVGLRAKIPKKPEPDERRDFTISEVARLLELPLFTGAMGERGPNLYRPGPVKIDDWRVWVPMICLFTGMRLNEACGLAVQDVRVLDRVAFFHVRDEVEGQSLKSIAARRKVPIHDELLRVGFLNFVERQKARGRTRLFEELREDASGYFSTRPSKFFNRLIDRIEDDKPEEPGALVFHSLRHTVTTRLRIAEVRIDVAKEIVGHEQGEVHAGYGAFPLPMLREAVNKISYPGLDLSQVARD